MSGGHVICAFGERSERGDFMLRHAGEFKNTASLITKKPPTDTIFITSVWELPGDDE